MHREREEKQEHSNLHGHRQGPDGTRLKVMRARPEELERRLEKPHDGA